MRERAEIENIGEGDWDGADYSQKLALRNRTLEVLLDIRELLEKSEERMVRMEENIASYKEL